jgi:competence protein ComEA
VEILRARDQRIVAAIVFAALLGLAIYWLATGGLSGAWVDLEEAPQRTAKFQVDINRAPWPEIAELPGIGETLARRIILSRDRDGLFTSVSDLERVNGIGRRTAQRLQPYLILPSVDHASPASADH